MAEVLIPPTMIVVVAHGGWRRGYGGVCGDAPRVEFLTIVIIKQLRGWRWEHRWALIGAFREACPVHRTWCVYFSGLQSNEWASMGVEQDNSNTLQAAGS